MAVVPGQRRTTYGEIHRRVLPSVAAAPATPVLIAFCGNPDAPYSGQSPLHGSGAGHCCVNRLWAVCTAHTKIFASTFSPSVGGTPCFTIFTPASGNRSRRPLSTVFPAAHLSIDFPRNKSKYCVDRRD